MYSWENTADLTVRNISSHYPILSEEYLWYARLEEDFFLCE